jgi:hypothetical protein
MLSVGLWMKGLGGVGYGHGFESVGFWGGCRGMAGYDGVSGSGGRNERRAEKEACWRGARGRGV